MSMHTTTATKPEIRNEDLLALKNYVTACDGPGQQYSHLSDQTLLLDLTHSNLQQKHIEIRFDKHSTIFTLKEKIYQKTGTSASYQHLQIIRQGQVVMEIPAGNTVYDSYKLGYFQDGLIENGTIIHCVDTNPLSGSKGGQYEDVSLIEKYRMSDEEYNARKGTLRDWARKQQPNTNTGKGGGKKKKFSFQKHAKDHAEKVNAMRLYKLGLSLPDGWEVDKETGNIYKTAISSSDEEDEEEIDEQTNTTSTSAQEQQAKAIDEKYGEDSINGIQLESRCQVQPGGRRGQVKYVGEIEGIPGYWVGIQFDEPTQSSSSRTSPSKMQEIMEKAKEKYMVDIPPTFAGFCRGKNVEVGDFPELDLFSDDSDSEDEL